MLGACQHDWLVRGLHESPATWKIVLTPVSMNKTIKTWDSWSRFSKEREDLLESIKDVPNVIFISGDVHSGGAIDDGSHSGRIEVATPHANMPTTWVNTFCKPEHGDTLVSRPGSWTIGGSYDPILDVRPLQCGSRFYPDDTKTDGLPAQVYPLDGKNNPGYTWITATRTTLQLAVHDARGKVKRGVNAAGVATDLSLTLSAASH